MTTPTSSNSFRRSLEAAGLAMTITATACSETSEGPTGIGAAGVAHAVSATDTVACTNTEFSFRKCWSGSPSIAVRVPYSVSQANYDDLAVAVTEWQKLLAEGTFSAPKLDINRGTGGNVDVAFAATSSLGYCGVLDGDRQHYTLTLYPLGHARCANSAIGDITQVVRHELAHAVGWEEGAEGNQVVGVSDHCTLNNAGREFRDQVCLHEVEGAFRAYRNLAVPTDFWGRGILKRTNLDTARIQLQAGQGRQLVVSSFSSHPPASYDLTLPASAANLVFRSGATAVATVSSTGLVTAQAAGTSRITVSGVPAQVAASGFLLWSPNEATGDSVRVVVSVDTRRQGA